MWQSTSTILYPSLITRYLTVLKYNFKPCTRPLSKRPQALLSPRHDQRLDALARLQQLERFQAVIQIIAMRDHRLKIDRAASHRRDCSPPGLGRAHARGNDTDAVEKQRAQLGSGDVARRPSELDQRASLAHDMARRVERPRSVKNHVCAARRHQRAHLF